MARKRDPRRDEAFEIFKNAKGSITNREIAEKLKVPEKTISAWKSRDKWNAVLQKDDCSTANEKCSTTNKGGAPLGSKNAKGNKGGKAPPGNKNAVKTGEYETIFADTLSDEEKEIYSSLDNDPSFILLDEIRILKIRQRRMMQRIKDSEEGLNEEEVQTLEQLRKDTVPVERDGQKAELKRYVLKEVEVVRKTYRKIDNILALEEALTRVSTTLTRAVKQLNDLNLNEKKIELMDQQIMVNKSEMERQKIGNDKKNITIIMND